MNKLTKLLSVFVIAGAIGTGIAGVAGCSNKNDNNNAHTHNYTYVNDNNGKHHEHCSVSGCDAPDKTAEEHTWGADDKCTKCDATKPAEGLVVAANVTGIIIEGVTSETITLSETNKSHTINKSAIKVYFATGNNADVKGDEVPAANVVLELKDSAGAAVSSWENITKDGVYKVNASLKDATMASGATATLDDLKKSVTITVSNPIKAGSLAVKTGTLTQTASVQDKMSGDWTYTVTLANGDVVDYTETVTVTVDTSTVGKHNAALASGNLTGSVEVEITASELRTETYAANLSNKETGTLADQAPDAEAVELFKSANGNTKLVARGVNIQANSNSRAQECDGKYFAQRATLAGATFTAAGALQSNQRYFILNTEGAAKLTIYWSRNSSADERGVSVFNSTVAGGDISTLTPTAETVGKATLASGATDDGQAVQKMEVNIPAAGTYWITSANNQNVYFYYIELTTEFEGTGTSVVLEDGEKTLAKMEISNAADTEETKYVQQFNVGATFSVDSGYTVKGTFITANTAKKSTETVTENLKYYVGETELVPGTTVLTADLFTALGENDITVKYGTQTVTGSYKINVVNALGVNSVSAALKSGVLTEVAQASSTINVTWANFELTTEGSNSNVDAVITAASYVAKDAAAGTEGTAIAENGTAIGVGSYVVTLTVKVTDKTNTALTDTFTATYTLNISVVSSTTSWLYQKDNATVGADNPDIAKDATIAENSAFKAEALCAAKSGYNRNNEQFESSITNADNKPVAAADQTASGEELTFTNAVAFDTKAGDGTDYIKITAKKAVTVYVYINASDDKHGSNRSGSIITYSVNGGTAVEKEVGNRKVVTVVKVTLAADDVLVVGAKKGSATDPRIWFYGIEAVDVA